MNSKAIVAIMLTLLSIGICCVTFNVGLVRTWSNGGYSTNPSNPNYGTHDWIAEHALDWLPTVEKQYIVDNLAPYLYGTELPDNGAAFDGIGDVWNHHVYFWSNESLQDDSSAVRAGEEYNNTLNFLNLGDLVNASKTAGIMTHYIVDVAVFGHVMGSGTDWGAETHHSDYETYVNLRTDSYDDEFNTYLSFDGELSIISAYDATIELAYDTTFDADGDLTCAWMDQNYNWSDPIFKDRCGESLNLAVNSLTDVLHTLYLENLPVHNVNSGKNFSTIQEAINDNETLDGHTIFVEAGTYYENVVVNKSISLIGENKMATTIDGNETGNVVYVIANNVTISGFTIRNSGTYNMGIYLDNSSNSSVYDNKATNNYYNIVLQYCSNCYVYGNNASNNDCYGIALSYSSGNAIYGNNASNNNGVGISLFESPNCSIYGNNANNNTYQGIELAYSCSNCSVYDNNANYNEGVGIWLVDSSNCSIYGNNANNNVAGGIALASSYNNTITDNNAKSNTQDGIILSLSDNNEVSDNNIESNRDGINVDSSSNNRVLGNNITNNNWRGVFIFQASDNKFYHNNFIDNGIRHVEFYYSGYANVWDDGYPSGGNYWSDYAGVDVKSGPNQDQLGSDGIGDTPYVIDANNTDYYPLIVHDVGITNVALSKTVVGQGYNVAVNVTIFNYGNYFENFSVAACANETLIQNQTATLTSRNSVTITFTWNTTGFAYGNYTITANVTVLQGETETINNNYTDGWIFVTIIGDVDGDRDVDVGDQRKVQLAMFTTPASPSWNANMDIDSDLDVDVGDQRKQQLHMFESW